MRRIVRAVLTAGLAGGLFATTGAAPAGADVGEVGGGAFGVFADVSAPNEPDLSIGPLPQVTLPPEGGGPFTDAAAEVSLAFVLFIEALSVSTEGALGPDGFAASSAEALNVDLFDSNLVAASVSAECVASEGDVEGSVSLVDIEIADVDDPIPVNPDPNTTIDVFDDGTLVIILNEQVVAENGITVTAIRVLIDIPEFATGEVAVSQAECSVLPAAEEVVPPAEPVPAEVTFTG